MASDHVQYIRSRVKMSLRALTDELKLSDSDDPMTVIDLRGDSIQNDKGSVYEVVRCFVRVGDADGLAGVGWVVNAGCSDCLLCGSPFGSFKWRHHCRACGLLICNTCSRFAKLDPMFPEPERFCCSCKRFEHSEVFILNNQSLGKELVPDDVSPTVAPKSTSPTVARDPDGPRGPEPHLSIVPLPGYVIKTRRTSGDKIFINVYHHHLVKDESGTLTESVFPPEPDQRMVPRFYHSPPLLHVGPDGFSYHVYSVVVSSKYFLSPDTPITSPICVQKIIECLNGAYSDSMMEDEYVRPRIKSGVKGHYITEPIAFEMNTTACGSICRISPRDDNRSVASRQSSLRPRAGYAASLTDEQSVVSDLTIQSGAVSWSSMALFTLANKRLGDDGRALLTEDSAVLKEALDAKDTEVKALLEKSTVKPSVLLGWQVTLGPFGADANVDPDLGRKVYVITGIFKNRARQSEYRLSCLDAEDIWVRLQRNSKKHGLPFRPYRKVLEID